MGKVDKIYLDNTNLIYSLANDNSNPGNIRETFFLNQLRVKYDVIVSPIADFQYCFISVPGLYWFPVVLYQFPGGSQRLFVIGIFSKFPNQFDVADHVELVDNDDAPGKQPELLD